MENLITIVIADDHYVFREDLKSLILKNGRFRIVGEASNGKVAWEQIERLQPDIALLDINMPTVNGLVTAARIEKSPVNLKVIVVTAFKDESLFNKAMDVGVIGYVLKDNYVTDIPLALQTVGRGHPFFSDSIAPFAAKRARKLDLSNSVDAGINDLTPTELRVLRLIAENLSNDEIGKQLAMSAQRVDTYRKGLQAKLKLVGCDALLAFAEDHKAELKGFKLIPRDF